VPLAESPSLAASAVAAALSSTAATVASNVIFFYTISPELEAGGYLARIFTWHLSVTQ